MLALRHENLLIRAETPLKYWYTLIERSNTLIEQSDHLATETRMGITGLDTGIKKRIMGEFSGRNNRWNFEYNRLISLLVNQKQDTLIEQSL